MHGFETQVAVSLVRPSVKSQPSARNSSTGLVQVKRCDVILRESDSPHRFTPNAGGVIPRQRLGPA